MDDGIDNEDGLFTKIKQVFKGKKESIARNRVENSEFEYGEIEEMAKKAKGESVTATRIARISSHLDRDEQPHFFNKGGSYFGLRIEGGDTEIRKGNKGKGPLGTFNNMSGNLLVATDKRVLIISMQTTGDDVHSIPYDSITGVDSAKGFPVKITVQTHGRTYHMETGNEEDDLSELTGYIREMRTQSKESTPSGSTEKTPLEKVEKLGELKEKGVLSEEEFNIKKERLLDEI